MVQYIVIAYDDVLYHALVPQAVYRAVQPLAQYRPVQACTRAVYAYTLV